MSPDPSNLPDYLARDRDKPAPLQGPQTGTQRVPDKSRADRTEKLVRGYSMYRDRCRTTGERVSVRGGTEALLVLSPSKGEIAALRYFFGEAGALWCWDDIWGSGVGDGRYSLVQAHRLHRRREWPPGR